MKSTDGSKKIEKFIWEGNALMWLQKENWDLYDAYKSFCRANQISPYQNIEGNIQDGSLIYDTSDIHTTIHKSNGKYSMFVKNMHNL